jgi:hypothetical protein
MFRALATLAGTLETLSTGYPILDVAAEIGGDEMKERMTPTSMGEYLPWSLTTEGGRRSAPRIIYAPRVSSSLA